MMQVRNDHHSRHRSAIARRDGPPRRTFHSPWAAWVHGHTRSLSSQDDLAILRDAGLRPVREPHGFTQEQAIKLALESGKECKSSGKEIRWTMQEQVQNYSELPFLLFNDIDATLFSGVLKGNVYLTWARLPHGLSGMTTRPGRGCCPRTTIELSQDLQLVISPEDLVSTLLHQMIHAYLLQCCGHKNVDVAGTGHDLMHKLDFSAIATIMQKRLVPSSSLEYPATWGCAASRPRRHDLRGGRHAPHKALRPPSIEAGSSNCDARQHGYHFADCRTLCMHVKAATPSPKLVLQLNCPLDDTKIPRPISQYLHVIEEEGGKPLPKLRSTYDSSATFIELHFQGRAYPVPRSQLTNVPSVSDKTSTDQVLRVTGNDEIAFRILYSFLRSGTYGPSLDDRIGNPDLSKVSDPGASLGPPRIEDYLPDVKPFLLPDIKAYRLATTIDIPELKKNALERLYAQTFTTDDACAALEEVYHGGPMKSAEEAKKVGGAGAGCPDNELRKWVRDWLKVAGRGDYESNLQLLQKHPVWKDKYLKLRERGSELITDIDTVEAELAKEKEKKKKEKAEQAEKERQEEMRRRYWNYAPDWYDDYGQLYDVEGPPGLPYQAGQYERNALRAALKGQPDVGADANKAETEDGKRRVRRRGFWRREI